MDESYLRTAVVAFHNSMEASYMGGWVDCDAYAIVEALLRAGWLPPSDNDSPVPGDGRVSALSSMQLQSDS